MPTILMVMGWRFFFFSNEGDEPIHIRCQKEDAEAKYWLDTGELDIVEDHAYGMSPADKRTVRKIIFEHFDYIVTQWFKLQERKNE